VEKSLPRNDRRIFRKQDATQPPMSTHLQNGTTKNESQGGRDGEVERTKRKGAGEKITLALNI